MRAGRHAGASLVGLLLAALPGPVRAQPLQAAPVAAAPPLAARLEYTRDAAAARCADTAALQDAVSRQLGAPVFEREPATHLVRVQIARARRGLRAQIEVRSADGTPLGAREIDSRSSDCAELSSALALAIAIALDPTRLFSPSAPPPSPAAALACPAPPVCPVCPLPTRAPPPPRAAASDDAESGFRGLAIAAGGGVGIGALPAVSGAGLFELAARFTRASVQLALLLHPGASGGALAGSGDDDPVEAQLLLGELALCGRFPLDAAWTFAACALGSAGALRGNGAASGERVATLTAALGAQARIERDLAGPLFAEARAELQANLVRTTLNVGGMPAWTTPPVWGQVGVLAGLRFP